MSTESETVTVTGEFTFEYDTENLDAEGEPKEQAKRLAENSLLNNPTLLQDGLSATSSGE